MGIAPENTSGQGSLATIPKEIRGWNWGAFFFGWLWGISNRVWISLLSAIPYVGVIMGIVLGVKGNEWAWRHKKWDSIEHFKNTQRKWGIAAAVVFVAIVIIYVVVLIAGSVPFTTLVLQPEPPIREMPAPPGPPSPPPPGVKYIYPEESSTPPAPKLAQVPIPTSPTPTSPIGLTEQEIEDGWIRLRIADVGSIDYPGNFLELSSGDYASKMEGYYNTYDLTTPSFTLQQIGLNQFEPSSFETYRRVIFNTKYLSQGDVFIVANEKYALSKRELAEMQDEMMDQLRHEYEKLKNEGVGDNKIVDHGFLEIVEVNGMFPLKSTYKRQLNDSPVVVVNSYMFFDNDMIHFLTFSCRTQDEEYCRDIYEKILHSFRIQ